MRQGTWCYGGSARILVTMFPKAFGGAAPEPPQSFFWALPGQRPLHFDSPHFADQMSAYTRRTLLPSHFTDYATNLSSAPEFPQNPYTLTYTP